MSDILRALASQHIIADERNKDGNSDALFAITP